MTFFEVEVEKVPKKIRSLCQLHVLDHLHDICQSEESITNKDEKSNANENVGAVLKIIKNISRFEPNYVAKTKGFKGRVTNLSADSEFEKNI